MNYYYCIACGKRVRIDKTTSTTFDVEFDEKTDAKLAKLNPKFRLYADRLSMCDEHIEALALLMDAQDDTDESDG